MSNMHNIYQLIGKVIEAVQYIEYNLIISITYAKVKHLFDNQDEVAKPLFDRVEEDAMKLKEEMRQMSFGQIISIVESAHFLDAKEIEDLKELLRKRNDLVHQFFKVKDFVANYENRAFLDNQFGYLKNFYEEVLELNERLNIKFELLRVWYEGVKNAKTPGRLVETVEFDDVVENAEEIMEDIKEDKPLGQIVEDLAEEIAEEENSNK